MFAYCLTYVINAIGGIVNKRSKKIITMIVLICLAFMSGTRYYMGGSDVYVYENVYNGAPSLKAALEYLLTGVSDGVNINYEPGYLFICSLIKSFGCTYFGFTLIYAILFYVLMYKGLKPFVEDWNLVLAIFMYKIFFYDTFISIRQGLTIALFCYGLHFILEKKIVKYAIICYLAFLVHRGSLILFPLYFLQYVPISKRMISSLAIGFLPTRFISGAIDLNPVFERIVESIGFEQKSGWVTYIEQISWIHTLECYMVFAVIILFYNRIIKANQGAKLILQLSLVLLPIFTLFSNWLVLTRIKDYFVILYGVILGYAAKDSEKDTLGSYIPLAAYALSIVGMIRYVLVFDGGVLMRFTSFLFEGGRIFTWL